MVLSKSNRFNRIWNEIYEEYKYYIIFNSDNEANVFKEKIKEKIIKEKVRGRSIDKYYYSYIVACLNSKCSTKIPLPINNDKFVFKFYQKFFITQIKQQNNICDAKKTISHYLNLFIIKFKEFPFIFCCYSYPRFLQIIDKNVNNLQFNTLCLDETNEDDYKMTNVYEIMNKTVETPENFNRLYHNEFDVNFVIKKVIEIYNNLDVLKFNLFKFKDFIIDVGKIECHVPQSIAGAIIYIYFKFYIGIYISQKILSHFFKLTTVTLRRSIKILFTVILNNENQITDSFITQILNNMKIKYENKRDK